MRFVWNSYSNRRRSTLALRPARNWIGPGRRLECLRLFLPRLTSLVRSDCDADLPSLVGLDRSMTAPTPSLHGLSSALHFIFRAGSERQENQASIWESSHLFTSGVLVERCALDLSQNEKGRPRRPPFTHTELRAICLRRRLRLGARTRRSFPAGRSCFGQFPGWRRLRDDLRRQYG
jgi:hypothetical protein